MIDVIVPIIREQNLTNSADFDTNELQDVGRNVRFDMIFIL